MSWKPDRRYGRGAACWAVHVTYRSAIAICATLPVVFPPAVAQTAEGENAAGFVTRLGEIAGSLYGTARRDLIDPARQMAADLVADLPGEPLAIEAGERLNAAARAIAATARSFVLEPVARQSAGLMDRAELGNWYPAAAAMAHDTGEELRRAILPPGSEPAAGELPAGAAALSWIATAADVPRPAPPVPSLPD